MEQTDKQSKQMEKDEIIIIFVSNPRMCVFFFFYVTELFTFHFQFYFLQDTVSPVTKETTHNISLNRPYLLGFN